MREFLKQARLEKGYTQKQLADMTGLTERYIRYLESGERDGCLKVLKDISLILGVDMNLF
ncbi:helix-turn-helix transcriptional regulator [Clostridium sp. MSJ-11]|uniref:Helix-turn-helix transcriptional regulator n=1 Tax=Clostridium mobile TaxID=2841512 RepID=A0ABS6EMI6_9CLOT|nr:helix-turn-helix transcriptional regulator [Clostridium mobile]